MTSLTVYQIYYGYVSKFLDYETFNFWEVLNFVLLPSPPPPHGGFQLILITLFPGMKHCLFFQGLKDHRFLNVSAISLV